MTLSMVLRIGKFRVSKCLDCGSDLGLLRTWMGWRFCSKQHERKHMEELNEIALTRLEETEKRLVAYLQRNEKEESA